MAYLTWRRDLIRSRWYERGHRPAHVDGDRMALATVVNDDFVPYLAVLVHSLLRHHPGLTYPWIVFWNPVYSPLSDQHREMLAALYPGFDFREVDASRYERFLRTTPKKFLAALFTLETFSLTEFDRVWFIDADIVCLGDCSRLWETRAAIAGCRSGNDHRDKQWRQNMFVWDGGFNSGVFMVGKPYLSRETYEALFKVPYKDFADQEILNKYFTGRPVYLLPHTYNYHAEFFWDRYAAKDDIRLLHYAGAKPLKEPDLPRMKPWWAAARELAKAHPEWSHLVTAHSS
jgi:lipopolysaccharide biosynthesis glycosyltransferase